MKLQVYKFGNYLFTYVYKAVSNVRTRAFLAVLGPSTKWGLGKNAPFAPCRWPCLLSLFILFSNTQGFCFQLSSIKTNYLMISTVLICKDCGDYARIILGTIEGIIALAVLPVFFVNTKPANKTSLEQIDIL